MRWALGEPAPHDAGAGVRRVTVGPLGIEWMTPDLFRFGASSLLNDVLLQLRKQRTGIYRSPDEFTLD